MVLIGNKCDLKSKREVNCETAEAMAINNGLKYFETSAKENINLDHVFYEISKDIFNEVKTFTIHFMSNIVIKSCNETTFA